MVGLSNFFHYEDELVAVYRRFGTGSFTYHEISDLVSRRAMSQLMTRGCLTLVENRLAGRSKVNRWQLQAGVVDQCQEALQGVKQCPVAR